MGLLVGSETCSFSLKESKSSVSEPGISDQVVCNDIIHDTLQRVIKDVNSLP